MQRVVNYGSFLQAYALKKIISNMHCNVEFIDYKFERDILDKSDDISLIKKIYNHRNIFEYLKKKKIQRKFSNRYDEFLELIGVKKEKNYNKNIDELVIGSDEVFNCLQHYPVGYSRNLFGHEYESVDVISYAGCFGHTTINELKKYGIYSEIKEMLSKFKSISVRDLNSYNIVSELLDKKPEIHLDPVLIGNFEEEMLANPVDSHLKNYIVIYAYPGRLTKHEEKFIKRFAKENGKLIISLGTYQRIADKIIVANPFEVLNYIKNADFVITDTFHGSIFSIITHSSFCTIVRNSNSNKLSDLLHRLNLDDVIINNISDLDKYYNNEISFDKTDEIIRENKEKSIKYLEENIIRR